MKHLLFTSHYGSAVLHGMNRVQKQSCGIYLGTKLMEPLINSCEGERTVPLVPRENRPRTELISDSLDFIRNKAAGDWTACGPVPA